MSAPSLNFDEFPSEITSACSGRLILLSYLERFLFHRGHNKIQSFRVRWEGHAIDENVTPCMCDDEHYRLNTWIQNAVRCNVEVLDLRTTLNNNEVVYLPSCVFLCSPLRSLVVDMTPMVLRTPSFAFSSNLKFLKLEKVYIEGDDFFKWISHSCKCIEDLHLRYLVGIEQVTIFRSSLKRFSFARGPLDQVNHINISSEKLVDFDLCWTFDSPSNKSLNIDAPNLKHIKWIGNLMKYPSLGILECLERAIVFLQPEVDDLDKLHEVLWSLRRAPALFLNDVVIKASLRNGFAPASLRENIQLVNKEMSQRRKLGDVASCGDEGVCGETESEIDRFSDLPDQVAHHILSFLSVPYLCRVCCVSKRRLTLLTYLERFLFHRGDNKIQSFHVRWERHDMDGDATPCICDNENYRLSPWIQNAVRCNVEVFDLKMTFYANEVKILPSCVFLSATLRSLVVDVEYMVLRTPCFAVSSNLKYLKLENVHIQDEDFFKWISHSCKCMEDLHLTELHGIERITIFGSSLKRFSFLCGPRDHISHMHISSKKLVDLDLYWKFDSPSNKSLNIDAPNLKSIHWIGNLMEYPNLGKLECLEKVAFALLSEVHDFDKIHEVLWCLRRAPALFLNEVVIKASFRDGSAPASMYDTSCLYLNIECFVDELVPAVVSILRRTPKLSALCISSGTRQDPQSHISGFNMDYWKLQDLSCIKILKSVTSDLCSGSNGVEFAKFIIKHAPNMQRLIVICWPRDLEEVIEKK